VRVGIVSKSQLLRKVAVKDREVYRETFESVRTYNAAVFLRRYREILARNGFSRAYPETPPAFDDMSASDRELIIPNMPGGNPAGVWVRSEHTLYLHRQSRENAK